jgi:stringent starvation protein B
MRAVANLDLGNDWINFQARFSGASHAIHVPMAAVLALYAQENGQGMMFPAEDAGGDPPGSPRPEPDGPVGESSGKPKLGPPHLRIVK